MSLRHHEISEAGHRILNPFTEDKLMLLGEVCRLRGGQEQLDLACGKGEMLCRWAERFGH
jgi:cyclopropane fatty-acyl-phospholipid synthase-like methyltransferase